MTHPYCCRGEGISELDHCAFLKLDQCDYCQWYQSGNGLPHYPVPALMQNADTAITWSLLSTCRYHGGGPCLICIDKFLEALDYDLGGEDGE